MKNSKKKKIDTKNSSELDAFSELLDRLERQAVYIEELNAQLASKNKRILELEERLDTFEFQRHLRKRQAE